MSTTATVYLSMLLIVVPCLRLHVNYTGKQVFLPFDQISRNSIRTLHLISGRGAAASADGM